MNKIAAIIVTYNRKELLVENINNCLGQTHNLDKIYIIDNASNDNTEEHLFKNGIIQNSLVEYHKLSKNIGGAGGFNYGLTLAHQKGYDFYWMMDDDGRPDKDCLENLVLNIPDFEIVGPLIYCDVFNESHSPYYINKRKTFEIATIKESKYINPVHPFNGTLIKKCVVDLIGYPNKDLFIWGDEQEYRLRWLKNGFKEATITNANYYHPKNRLKFHKYWIFKTPDIKSNRKYLFYRNQVWISIRYNSIIYSIVYITWLLSSILFFEINKFNSFFGVYHGIINNLKDPRI